MAWLKGLKWIATLTPMRLAGWHVLRVWEHELGRRQEAQLLRRIRGALARGVRSAIAAVSLAPK